jgi:hypothetical protein
MRKTIIFIVATLIMFVNTACDEVEESGDISIEGIYIGTMTFESNLIANTDKMKDNLNAIAEVTQFNNNQIEVYFYGDEFEKLVLFNIYDHKNNIMICESYDKFEQKNGHPPEDEHLTKETVCDIRNDETEWIHHKNEKHEEISEYFFGSLNLKLQSFDYSFNMNNGVYHFQGSKE